MTRGIAHSDKTDFVVSMHVHPTGTDMQQALPEGERRVKRLEGHASVELVVADESKNQKGDLLWYDGRWYECVNAQRWDHTILAHTNYTFVLVATDGAASIDLLDPPTTDPNLSA